MCMCGVHLNFAFFGYPVSNIFVAGNLQDLCVPGTIPVHGNTLAALVEGHLVHRFNMFTGRGMREVHGL